MAVIEIDDITYGWLSRIMLLVSLIFTTLSLFWHAKEAGKRISAKKMDWTWSLVFSFLLIISSFITLLIWVSNAYTNISSRSACYFPIFASLAGFTTIKFILYMTLSFRLDAAFHGSIYKYSRKTLYSLRVFLCVGIIGATVISFRGMDAFVIDAPLLQCRAAIKTYALVVVALFDIVACSVNLFLFIRQLYRVTAALRRNDTVLDSIGGSSTNKENTHTRTTTDDELDFAVAVPPSPRGHSTQTSSQIAAPATPYTPPISNKGFVFPTSSSSAIAKKSKGITANSLSIEDAAKFQAQLGSDLKNKGHIRMPTPSVDSDNSNDGEFPPPTEINLNMTDDELGNGDTYHSGARGSPRARDTEQQIDASRSDGRDKKDNKKNGDKDKKNVKSRMKRASKKLSFRKKKENKDQKQKIFLQIVRKHVILTALGVISTVLTMMLIGVFSMAYFWASIDIIFNIIAVLLMFSWNKPYYERFCSCFQGTPTQNATTSQK